MGYLAQPGLKMALNIGCANGIAGKVERLFGTRVVPDDQTPVVLEELCQITNSFNIRH